MIDYFMRWANEAAAKEDALMLADKYLGGSSNARLWARDRVLPDVQAWRPSQDVVSSGSSSGGIPSIATHTYLPGWFAIVSTEQQLQPLLNLPALQFALDRVAFNAGQPFVVRNNIGAIIQDVGVSPIFAGSNYPIGGFSSS